jgi:hypothetical protein
MFCEYKVKIIIPNKKTFLTKNSSPMKTFKQKIIEYLKIKGLSQDHFSRTIQVSSGFLRQGKSFSIEYLKSIRDNYLDLNMDWLIYNEGNMLLSDGELNENPSNYTVSSCKNCKLLESIIKAKDETIAILKHQLGITDE